jgi:hypothetical protein
VGGDGALMANSWFLKGLEGFAKAEIDWDTAVIKAAMVRGYTFSASTSHKFVSDLTGASGVIHGTPVALTSPTATDGVLNAMSPLTFTGHGTSASDHYLIIYQASAVTGGADVATSAQRLIMWIDTAAGLPLHPQSGQDVQVNWDTGANRIARL